MPRRASTWRCSPTTCRPRACRRSSANITCANPIAICSSEVTRLRKQLPRLGRNGLKPSEIVAILDETSDEARLLIRVATDSWLVRQRLDQYQRRLRHIRSILTGDDLRQMGLPPGRLYSQILTRLRAAHLDGEIASREDEERLVREMLAGSSDRMSNE